MFIFLLLWFVGFVVFGFKVRFHFTHKFVLCKKYCVISNVTSCGLRIGWTGKSSTLTESVQFPAILGKNEIVCTQKKLLILLSNQTKSIGVNFCGFV